MLDTVGNFFTERRPRTCITKRRGHIRRPRIRSNKSGTVLSGGLTGGYSACHHDANPDLQSKTIRRLNDPEPASVRVEIYTTEFLDSSAQVGVVEMGVTQDHLQGAMAEDGGQGAEIDSTHDQPRSGRVPEVVHADMWQPSPYARPFESLPEHLVWNGRQPTPDEDEVFRTPTGDERRQGLDRWPGERHRPSVAVFRVDEDKRPAVDVDLPGPDAGRLAPPSPAATAMPRRFRM